MLIYLIRHGETDFNRDRRYQGATDTPLSVQGRAMLRPPEDCPSTVYVSPLLRAVETAALLFPHATLIPVPGLEEMNFGIFEGRSANDMEYDSAYRQWVAGGCEGRCPGGENRKAFCRRVCAAFVPLVDQAIAQGADALYLVAHGGTQMSILEAYGQPKRPYYRWITGNGCGFVLDTGEWQQSKTLRLVGEVRYLREGIC